MAEKYWIFYFFASRMVSVAGSNEMPAPAKSRSIWPLAAMSAADMHEEAWKNGEASYRKKVGKLGDVVSFWIPVDGYPDYLVHFSVGSIQKYEYNV